MANFQNSLEYVLKHEGGLSENKADRGGCTNFGISLRFLREVSSDNLKRCGIFTEVNEDTIRNLTRDQAERIYYTEFWMAAPFEKIINNNLAKYIFDMSINMGLHQAVKIAQRACCSAQKVKDYVKDDGIMGAKTLQAINQASFMLIAPMISERTAFYRQLVALDKKQSVFFEGWLVRSFDI